MSDKGPIQLTYFKKKVAHTKSSFRKYLTKLEEETPKGIDKAIAVLETEMWQETQCLDCANCCKTMTPTYTEKDIKRISAHLGVSAQAFKDTYLKREKGGDRDWLNKTEPCVFLNLMDNKCSIYEVRPADCAGFPHLRKKFVDYVHVHRQNIEHCPATYRLVEKMMERL